MTTITIHNAKPFADSEPFDLKVTFEESDWGKIRFNLSSEPNHWREVSRWSREGADDWKQMNQFLVTIRRLVLTHAGMP